MKLDFFDDFQDPYLKTKTGKGVFLSGLVLGMLARVQAGKGALDSAPMFKQIYFGRMQRRDLLRHLSRLPHLTWVYSIEHKNAEMLEDLCKEAGRFLLEGESRELGVDGNFAFSIAFLNAPDYFFGRVFKKQDTEEQKNKKEGNENGI